MKVIKISCVSYEEICYDFFEDCSIYVSFKTSLFFNNSISKDKRSEILYNFRVGETFKENFDVLFDNYVNKTNNFEKNKVLYYDNLENKEKTIQDLFNMSMERYIDVVYDNFQCDCPIDFDKIKYEIVDIEKEEK